MAEVFRNVGGKKLTKIIALHQDTQDKLDDVVLTAALKAEAKLIQHRAEGHAFIDIEDGKVDRYLVLNDERGLKAALSIEYGRKELEPTEDDPTGQSGMQGLFILHDAMGVPIKRGTTPKGGADFE